MLLVDAHLDLAMSTFAEGYGATLDAHSSPNGRVFLCC